MKKYWNWLPRPAQVIIYAIVILLCIALTIQLLWTGPYNPEALFRKMETAELIGPSRILAIVDTPDFDYSHLVIAEDGDHVVLCGMSKGVQNHHYFAYRPKQGAVTVYCAPINQFSSLYLSHYYESLQIPVVLLDNHPQATRAEIRFTTSYDIFQKSYTLSASRTAEGVFILPILVSVDTAASQNECQALEYFAQATGANDYDSIRISIPVQVRLFDSVGNLIHEETVTVQSPADQLRSEAEATTP